MIRRLMYLLVLMGMLSGCATIVSGPSQKMSFSSTPDNVIISVDNVNVGNTPITVDVRRGTGKLLILEKEGYYPKKMLLTTKFNNWFWGNIVCGGLCSATDALTKSILEYAPNNYHATLDPMNAKSIIMNIYELRQEVKLFIMSNYSDIIKELAAGQGEYLNALLQVLNIENNNAEGAIKKIKGLSDAYLDIPEFSEKVVELFMGKATT
jgi:uncharacterized protein YceK